MERLLFQNGGASNTSQVTRSESFVSTKFLHRGVQYRITPRLSGSIVRYNLRNQNGILHDTKADFHGTVLNPFEGFDPWREKGTGIKRAKYVWNGNREENGFNKQVKRSFKKILPERRE